MFEIVCKECLNCWQKESKYVQKLNFSWAIKSSKKKVLLQLKESFRVFFHNAKPIQSSFMEAVSCMVASNPLKNWTKFPALVSLFTELGLFYENFRLEKAFLTYFTSKHAWSSLAAIVSDFSNRLF